jgi:hypothetical protein
MKRLRLAMNVCVVLALLTACSAFRSVPSGSSALSPSSPIAADACSQTAPACPLLSAGQQSGDLLVWLSSTPAQPVAGNAELDAFVTNRAGEPISGLQITYHADMTNMSHGLYLVATEPIGIGHYAGDVHFSMPGPWRVITIIERPGP